MPVRLVAHAHAVYRVVRAGWPDPLDTSFSRDRGGRWNAPGSHRVLYTCCSLPVARAVAREALARAGVTVDDLQPAFRPILVEVAWRGQLVDVASAEGVSAAALPATYPRGTGYTVTQPLGRSWHEAGIAGVVCRSAALSRAGLDRWEGPHEPFGEAALFVDNTSSRPSIVRRHEEA
jgi:RES domain-containing protein